MPLSHDAAAVLLMVVRYISKLEDDGKMGSGKEHCLLYEYGFLEIPRRLATFLILLCCLGSPNRPQGY